MIDEKKKNSVMKIGWCSFIVSNNYTENSDDDDDDDEDDDKVGDDDDKSFTCFLCQLAP